MSDAAYYREYRKRERYKKWLAEHESKPERMEARRVAKKKYRDEHREQIATSTLATRTSGRQECMNAKNVPCADCGRHYPYYCMDFDHRPGESKHSRLTYGDSSYKRVPISMSALAASNIEAFREEAKKCDVVCANCHRIRTWSRRAAKALDRMCGDHKLDEAKA